MPRRELLQWSSPPPQNFDFKVLILKEPRNLAADHLPIGKPACVHGNEALEILPKLATRPTGRHHGANLTAKRSLTPDARIVKTPVCHSSRVSHPQLHWESDIQLSTTFLIFLAYHHKRP
ncbi:hypothetical protein Tco_1163425 [Tanacetum coccineum]